MAHPTEAELRQLGDEILELLARKTNEEYDSFMLAQDNLAREQYGGDMANHPPDTREDRGEEIMAYIRDAYSFLPDTFAEFAEPRPENFDAPIGRCAEALMVLQPSLEALNEQGRIWSAAGGATEIAGEFRTTVAERVNAVITQVGDWEGTAGNAFHLNYMNKFPQSLRDQHEVVFALAAALEAEQNIFTAVGADIRDIGQQTKNALNEITAEKDPTGFMVTFLVVAAVATVLSGGAATPAVGAAWAVVAASGSLAATAIGASADPPKKGEDTTIEGATTQQIMVSMMDRITDLYRYIDEQEDKVVRALDVVSGYVDELRTRLEIPPPEPYTDLGDASPQDVEDNFVHT